jgi:hypothetical protein
MRALVNSEEGTGLNKLTLAVKRLVGWILMKRDFRRGQITRSSKIGTWITLLSSLPSTNSILDVGTWSGAGTTLCIAGGVSSRRDEHLDNVSVIGVELNEKFAGMAKKRLRKYPFIRILQGTLVGPHQLDKELLSDEEKVWLENDLQLMRDAPLVINAIPLSLDLVILDGGEFSTYAEFLELKPRFAKWVVLDDVRTRKNRRVLEELSNDPAFALVAQEDERNGTAIFIKIK